MLSQVKRQGWTSSITYCKLSSVAYGASILVTTVAKKIIEDGLPADDYNDNLGSTFEALYGVPTILKRFDVAKKYFNENAIGISRDERDLSHQVNSLVILPIKDGLVAKFEDYKKEFTNDPIIALSNFETALMRDAARQMIQFFINAVEMHKNSEDFQFIVKLAYSEIDKEDGEKEHLWFDVHDFNQDSLCFDATLMNKPYYDIGISEGQRLRVELSRLTDWIIIIEGTHYNSSNIYMLFDDF